MTMTMHTNITYYVVQIRGDHGPDPSSHVNCSNDNTSYDSGKQFTRVHVENGEKRGNTKPRNQSYQDVKPIQSWKINFLILGLFFLFRLIKYSIFTSLRIFKIAKIWWIWKLKKSDNKTKRRWYIEYNAVWLTVLCKLNQHDRSYRCNTAAKYGYQMHQSSSSNV